MSRDLLAAASALVEARLADHAGLFVLGIAGAQGSGKSTLAKALAENLCEQGLACEVVSIDDFYLAPQDRQRLAAEVHSLLKVRGVPGTHDVALAIRVIDALRADEGALLPRFDKASDAPFSKSLWTAVAPGLRVLIFEGWCVGANPQPEAGLHDPVNTLEAEEDRAGLWRAFVNRQLQGLYRDLFARLDALIFLAAPDFSVVKDWRLQQERNIAGQGHAVMDEEGIARFIQFYQRITERMLEDLPPRADLVARLDKGRRVLSID